MLAAAWAAGVCASASACAQSDSTHNGNDATAAAPATSPFNAWRRLICVSEIPTFDLLCQVIRGAPRQRQNRERWVLFSRGWEGGTVNNEHVLDLMHLVEGGERRPLRVRA